MSYDTKELRKAATAVFLATDEDIAHDLSDKLNKAARIIDALREAIEPFAEEPHERMDSYPCHSNISTKERCGRCGRAIAAWNALQL